jgi:hypothetical protein
MRQRSSSRLSPRLFSRERRSFSRGIRVRLASFFVIVSVLFAFGARLSHMLLVQHAICQHGHLVDSVDSRDAQDEHRKESKLQKVQSADSIAQDEDREANNTDEHDHCDVLSVWHHHEDVAAIAPIKTLSWIERPGLQKASPSQPIDIIALAPKSSPPNFPAV